MHFDFHVDLMVGGLRQPIAEPQYVCESSIEFSSSRGPGRNQNQGGKHLRVLGAPLDPSADVRIQRKGPGMDRAIGVRRRMGRAKRRQGVRGSSEARRHGLRVCPPGLRILFPRLAFDFQDIEDCVEPFVITRATSNTNTRSYYVFCFLLHPWV
jgi:hypothetical protein